MARFMDVHTGMVGLTREQLMAEHQKDLDIEKEESVHFMKAWGDPGTGMVFCLSEGPSREAVQRVHERAGHPAGQIYEVPIDIE